MKFKLLGNTGVTVSELCFGTMSFGGDADADTSAKMYAACRDKGIDFFDCANVYSKGTAETILGKLMAHERDDLVITSKFASPMSDERNHRGGSRRLIATAVEDSLKRLGTDRLDVYFMHHWDDDTPFEETLRAMENLVTQGKVLYLGASNHAAWQIAKGLGISERQGWPKVDVIQPMYSLVKRQVESEILPMAASENLGVISYSPVGGGLLSGKYAKDTRPDTGRIMKNKHYGVRYGEDWVFEVAGEFTALAAEHNIHPVSLAVAWVAANPAITCPIIGSRDVAQLQPSLDSTEVDMTPELYAAISALSPTPALATDRRDEQVKA